jgi:hypothetical protein
MVPEKSHPLTINLTMHTQRAIIAEGPSRVRIDSDVEIPQPGDNVPTHGSDFIMAILPICRPTDQGAK